MINYSDLPTSELKALEAQYTKELAVDGWFKFVQYNIIDCELVEKLNDKLNIIEMAIGVAYLAKMNFQKVFSPIAIWESFIYNELLKDKIAIPLKTKTNHREPFAGGHVKPTITGNYNWMVSFDLTSMYPHNIILNNISPETIVDEVVQVKVADLIHKRADTSALKEFNYTMAGNGQLFRRDLKGIFPTMMKELFEVRKTANSEMKRLKKIGGDKELISQLNVKQGSVKLLLNCLFGACGNPYFRYYDLRMAEGITLTGQVVIQWMERKMNEKLNKILKTDHDYIPASDTDSLYVDFGPLVKVSCEGKSTGEIVDFLEKISNQVFADFIDESLTELSEYLNAVEPCHGMKLENICDRGIFVKSKNYILNVHSSEGVRYDPPQLKVVGIALVKSSTPAIMRQSLRDAIPILLYKEENDIQEYVKEAKSKFMLESAENISFPRGLTELDKWRSSSTLYASRTPIHVRASIMHNHLIEKLGLSNKYKLIKSGDKIKFVYLKLPNPIHEDVIGYIGELPLEFGLHRFVDYERQFDSAFLKNLAAMCEPLKWELEKRASFAEWGI